MDKHFSVDERADHLIGGRVDILGQDQDRHLNRVG
jgi:hypothetical protein